MIGTDRTRKIARLRSYLHPSAADIKSLKSCKLTLSLINVLAFRITTDQYRTLNGKASMQFTSRFLDITLGSWAVLLKEADNAHNADEGN